MKRCREGDLALVIKSKVGNEGRFVTVERWAEPGEYRAKNSAKNIGAGWVVTAENLILAVYPDGSRPTVTGPDVILFDEWLLPIRPLKENEVLNVEDVLFNS